MHKEPDYLQPLVDLCIPYVATSYKNLDNIYQWKIPTKVPVPFKQGAEPLWIANRNLRAALSKAWRWIPEKRFKLTRWYVSDWGRIHTNADDTLRYYLSRPSEDLAGGPLRGVSTWSKILALQDPDHYQSYDARVATSLNALQLIHGASPVIVFKIPPSQNTLISEFRFLKRAVSNAQNDFRQKSYATYLRLVERVAAPTRVPKDVVEMVLFAEAGQLAKEAIEKL